MSTTNDGTFPRNFKHSSAESYIKLKLKFNSEVRESPLKVDYPVPRWPYANRGYFNQTRLPNDPVTRVPSVTTVPYSSISRNNNSPISKVSISPVKGNPNNLIGQLPNSFRTRVANSQRFSHPNGPIVRVLSSAASRVAQSPRTELPNPTRTHNIPIIHKKLHRDRWIGENFHHAGQNTSHQQSPVTHDEPNNFSMGFSPYTNPGTSRKTDYSVEYLSKSSDNKPNESFTKIVTGLSGQDPLPSIGTEEVEEFVLKEEGEDRTSDCSVKRSQHLLPDNKYNIGVERLPPPEANYREYFEAPTGANKKLEFLDSCPPSTTHDPFLHQIQNDHRLYGSYPPDNRIPSVSNLQISNNHNIEHGNPIIHQHERIDRRHLSYRQRSSESNLSPNISQYGEPPLLSGDCEESLPVPSEGIDVGCSGHVNLYDIVSPIGSPLDNLNHSPRPPPLLGQQNGIHVNEDNLSRYNDSYESYSHYALTHKHGVPLSNYDQQPSCSKMPELLDLSQERACAREDPLGHCNIPCSMSESSLSHRDDRSLPQRRGPGRPRKPENERKRKPAKSIPLWKFIINLLHNKETNPRLVKWENSKEGLFRIVKSDEVSRLWGNRKHNGKMNYEKFSRAMRYYYKQGIFEAVHGKRLVYKFGEEAKGWRPKNMDDPNFENRNS